MIARLNLPGCGHVEVEGQSLELVDFVRAFQEEDAPHAARPSGRDLSDVPRRP